MKRLAATSSAMKTHPSQKRKEPAGINRTAIVIVTPKANLTASLDLRDILFASVISNPDLPHNLEEHSAFSNQHSAKAISKWQLAISPAKAPDRMHRARKKTTASAVLTAICQLLIAD